MKHTCMTAWHPNLAESRKWLYFSLLSVFIWGMLAHGYRFVHDSFTHDSLSEFNGLVYGNAIKFESGRFLVPLYRNIFRTDLTLPWLIGILSLVWLSLAVFLVLRAFQVRSKIVAFLIAGIFTVNISVIATTATYLHDLDCDLFGVMCAAAAIYLWKKLPYGWIIGAFFVVAPLGIYQSNISVVITLVMMVCLFDLMEGERFSSVMKLGMKSIGMILIGGALYFFSLQIVESVTNIPLSTTNSNSLSIILTLSPQELITNLFAAYQNTLYRLKNVFSPYSMEIVQGATGLLACLSLGCVILWLCNRRISLASKLLCVVLILLLPLGANITYVLANGEVHDLMVFSVWLLYLLPLLLADRLSWQLRSRLPEQTPDLLCMLPRFLSAALIFFLLYGNVQTANTLYLKKDLEQKAYSSLMTRIVYDMERIDAYVPGTTPVVFAGFSDQIRPVRGTENYSQIIGVWRPGTIIMEDPACYQAYFDYVLAHPAKIADASDWYSMLVDPRVSDMPTYPAAGSIAFLDDILVVRLG